MTALSWIHSVKGPVEMTLIRGCVRYPASITDSFRLPHALIRCSSLLVFSEYCFYQKRSTRNNAKGGAGGV